MDADIKLTRRGVARGGSNRNAARGLKLQVVILAGGKGTRLAERLGGKPKPLVEVDGVPLLQRQVEALKAQGVTSFVVLVNHAADQIADFFGRHRELGEGVQLIDDGHPKGTAGALLGCMDALEDQFIVAYGDTLFSIDIARLLAAHNRAGADGTLFLHPNDHPQDSDLVELDGGGFISGFHPYPHPEGAFLPNLVNAAFYVLEKKALAEWLDFRVPSDLCKDLFPAMLSRGSKFLGYRSFEYIKDLGTPKRLDKVTSHLKSGLVERSSLSQRQRGIFFDRDGTLNEHVGLVVRADQLVLTPGAASAVKLANEAEYRAVLVTNQPVIARGDCSIEQLRHIHNKLETELGRAGAYLDAIYFCPHHPDKGYAGERIELKVQCDCRKPKPGLLLQAADDLNLDLARSWMIGDTTGDILAARLAGVRSVLVMTGEGGSDAKNSASPDFVASDVKAAVEFITVTHPAMALDIGEKIRDIQPGEVVIITGGSATQRKAFASVVAAELRFNGVPVEVAPDHQAPEPGMSGVDQIDPTQTPAVWAPPNGGANAVGKDVIRVEFGSTRPSVGGAYQVKVHELAVPVGEIEV